jgi:hypothetical protein
MKRFGLLVIGIIFACLGLLWFLQGADLIRINSILCFADCEPIIGGSLTWLITGVIVFVIGITTISFSIKSRTIHDKNLKKYI